MRPEDVAGRERLSAEGFLRARPAACAARRAGPGAALAAIAAGSGSSAPCTSWRTDPGGCWVAEVDGEMVGFATSLTRELMWILATYAVRPGLQGQGIGRELLAAALHHGRGCLRGMLSASARPARRSAATAQAGFTLHPQMYLTGQVDRRRSRWSRRSARVGAGDIDLMDSVDRRDPRRRARPGPRAAARAVPAGRLRHLDRQRLRVRRRARARRCCWRRPTGVRRPGCCGRRSPRTRRTSVDVPHVTAANEWAIDVGMAARLDLHQDGYLALRGMRPPAPYLHHGSLL